MWVIGFTYHKGTPLWAIKPLTTLTYLPRPTPKKPENSKSPETYSQEARELQEEGKAWAAHCARTEIPANPGGPRPPRAPGQRQGPSRAGPPRATETSGTKPSFPQRGAPEGQTGSTKPGDTPSVEDKGGRDGNNDLRDKRSWTAEA